MRFKLKPRRIAVLLVAAFLLLNVFACLHAYRMTHFVEAGGRTLRPWEMSLWQKAQVLLAGVNVPKPTSAWVPEDDSLATQAIAVSGYQEIALSLWHFAREEPSAVIVLFHGYAGEKSQVRRDALAFHRAGFDVYVADFHGSGRSAGNTTSIGYHEAEDVRAVFDVVSARHADGPDKPIILYGVSMGAAAIITAMHRLHVQPAAAILVSPFDSLLSTTKQRFQAMGVPAFPAAHCLTFWGGVMHGFNGFDYEPALYAKDIRVPVLIMHGEKDKLIRTEGIRTMYSNLSGPKELVLLSESGHDPFLITEPAKWDAAVFGFLDDKLQVDAATD